MIGSEPSRWVYLFALGLLAISGVFPVLPGKKTARISGFIGVPGFFLLIVAGALAFRFQIFSDFTPTVWSRGWIGSKELPGAMTVGVFQDLIGVVFSIFIGTIGLGLSVNRLYKFSDTPSRHREVSALALSVSGVMIAWFSLTPWICMAALTLTSLGGLLAFGEESQRSNDEKGSIHALRFAREKALGMLLALLGAAALFSSRGAVLWSAKADVTTLSGLSGFDFFSIALFYLGVLIQFQPFPFQGWLNTARSPHLLSRWVLGQALPAAAAFALLLRFEPYLKASGTLEVFGGVALCSSVLLGLFGIFQDDWQSTVSAWLASGFNLSVGALAIGGVSAGFPLFVGLVLCSAILSVILEKKPGDLKASPTVHHYLKTLSALTVLGGMGVLGFYSGDGAWSWLSTLTLGGAQSFIPFLPFLLFSVCGFVAYLRFKDQPELGSLSWPALIVSSLLFLFSLSIFWSGAFLGGVSPELFLSINSHFYEKAGGDPATAATYWTHLGLVLVSLGLAVLFVRKHQTKGKFSEFVRSGFKIDHATQILLRATLSVGEGIPQWVDLKLWSSGLPRLLGRAVHGVAAPLLGVDRWVSSGLRGIVRKTIAVPVLITQLIQNGDVQWYIFFGIGTGLAMLIHFVKP
jgi:hypothetical protein